jgi:MFS superfamily sulfate permease-like transporter
VSKVSGYTTGAAVHVLVSQLKGIFDIDPEEPEGIFVEVILVCANHRNLSSKTIFVCAGPANIFGKKPWKKYAEDKVIYYKGTDAPALLA